MLKVLQVVGTMNRGGAEVMLMDILRYKLDDVHFDFLVNNPPEDLYREGVFDEEILARGCRIRHIGTQLRIGPVQYVKRFRKIYEELSPDVVHIHLNAKCGIIALAANKAGCKRIITHCHADIRFRGSIINRFAGEVELFLQKILIARYATDYWGCSVEANQRLYWPWVRKRSVVINNAIDLSAYQEVNPLYVEKLRSSYNLNPDTIILGNVGRIVPHKNTSYVIDIMKELRDRGKDVAFVIVGRNDAPDYTSAMRFHAKELAIPDNRLLFLGERSDIPTVMHSFDVFVGPALKEGFGLVAVEAQAAGVPCVLYKGFPRSVDMKVGNCLFLDSFDVNKWADRIIESVSKEKIDKSIIAERIINRGFDTKNNAKMVCRYYIFLSQQAP